MYGASHSHVVRYYQAFFDNGAITIVMEHMDGGSLADILKLHKGLPERYIAELARQVGGGRRVWTSVGGKCGRRREGAMV